MSYLISEDDSSKNEDLEDDGSILDTTKRNIPQKTYKLIELIEVPKVLMFFTENKEFTTWFSSPLEIKDSQLFTNYLYHKDFRSINSDIGIIYRKNMCLCSL